MDSNKALETRKIAVTTTPKSEDFVRGCIGAVLVADAACFVDFDTTADTGGLLVPANQPITFMGQFTQISAVTASSTANLYILAIR